MLGLKRLQPAHELVVLGVADLWLIKYVVKMLMFADLVSQTGDLFGSVRRLRGHMRIMMGFGLDSLSPRRIDLQPDRGARILSSG